MGGAAAGEGVTVDEEEEGVGTGGVSDLLREGMAAGSLGTVVEGGGGFGSTCALGGSGFATNAGFAGDDVIDGLEGAIGFGAPGVLGAGLGTTGFFLFSMSSLCHGAAAGLSEAGAGDGFSGAGVGAGAAAAGGGAGSGGVSPPSSSIACRRLLLEGGLDDLGFGLLLTAELSRGCVAGTPKSEGSLSGVSALAVGAGGCGSGFGGFFIGSRTGFFLVGAGAAGLLGITGAFTLGSCCCG